MASSAALRIDCAAAALCPGPVSGQKKGDLHGAGADGRAVEGAASGAGATGGSTRANLPPPLTLQAASDKAAEAAKSPRRPRFQTAFARTISMPLRAPVLRWARVDGTSAAIMAKKSKLCCGRARFSRSNPARSCQVAGMARRIDPRSRAPASAARARRRSPPSASPRRRNPRARPLCRGDADRQPERHVVPGARRAGRRRRGARRGHAGHQDAARALRHHTPLVAYHEHTRRAVRAADARRASQRARRWRWSPTPARRWSPTPATSWSRRPSRQGIPVTPIPGAFGGARRRSSFRACRPTASSSRASCRPKSAARRTRLAALAAIPGTLVLFELPAPPARDARRRRRGARASGRPWWRAN